MRLALCICPQWSVQTPSFAIGSLKSHINNKDVVVDQIDLNILSSIYTKEKNIEKFWDWGNDKPWNSETNFQTEILPYFKELWHEYIEKLSTYDVVAFTTYTSNIITTDYIARYVKQLNPKIQIWYGGPYSWYSECGGLVEKDNYREFVDIACGSNDGERIISDLVNKYLEDGHYENIRGIYRWDKISPSFPTVLKKGRSGRTPVFNGGLLPQNLNELETPSWDESVIDDYRKLAELFDLEVTLPMQTSRGCTFKCTFCSETRLYRYKNNEKIVDEMKGLEAQTGINNFWFTDSLINGSMPNFKKFVDKLQEEINNGNIPKMYWGGHFRTHKKLDGELLTKAVDVGLNYMNVGVENGVNKILALMEKGQTSDDVSHFLKSAHESNVFYNANWIPGYPKENHMDFMLQLKFLYDNHKYFGNNGLLNLMQSTDILDHTPLDVYKDEFDVSREKTILNSWTSNDYKNILLIRHLRAFFIEVLLNTFNFTKEGEDLIGDDFSYATPKEKGGKPPYYRARIRENSLQVKEVEVELKEKKDDSIFTNEFLLSTEQNNIVDTIENEVIKAIKGFAWVLVNISNKSNINFIIRDNYKGYNLKDSHFNCNFSLKSNGNDFELDVEYGFKIGKTDKQLFDDTDNLDLVARNTINIKDNVSKYKYSNEVDELYQDSIDYKKHKVSFPRTEMTNQY
jgi:radical SAM superfamily enzyme YgiQ (UPF0313 family)